MVLLLLEIFSLEFILADHDCIIILNGFASFLLARQCTIFYGVCSTCCYLYDEQFYYLQTFLLNFGVLREWCESYRKQTNRKFFVYQDVYHIIRMPKILVFIHISIVLFSNLIIKIVNNYYNWIFLSFLINGGQFCLSMF